MLRVGIGAKCQRRLARLHPHMDTVLGKIEYETTLRPRQESGRQRLARLTHGLLHQGWNPCRTLALAHMSISTAALRSCRFELEHPQHPMHHVHPSGPPAGIFQANLACVLAGVTRRVGTRHELRQLRGPTFPRPIHAPRHRPGAFQASGTHPALHARGASCAGVARRQQPRTLR